MKTSLIFIILVALCGCTDKKATMVDEYIANNLKIAGYTTVYSSQIDSLKTEWEPNDETIKNLAELEKCRDRLNESGYNDIKITSDADYQLKELEKLSESKYANVLSGIEKEEFFQKVENWKNLWTEFKHYQDLAYGPKENFKPQFIGWKQIETIKVDGKEFTVEFHFNKDKTRITSHKKVSRTGNL